MLKSYKSTLIIILVIVSSLYFLESWAHKNFKPIEYSTKLRSKLIRKQPHIVLVGNSMLGSNIEKKVFENELKKKTGKNIRVGYVVAGGLHTAWYYLILKNQIANAVKPGTPIVFLDYEDYFVRPQANTAAVGKNEAKYRSTMKPNEDIFLSKIGDNSLYYASGFPYLYSQRFQIKRYLTSKAVMTLLRITGATDLTKSRRLKKNDVDALSWILGKTYKGSNFRGGQVDDRERNDREMLNSDSQENFNKLADKSFLPDILSFKDKFPIVFLLSSSNSNMALIKSTIPKHAAQLRNYIENNGGKFINMNEVEIVQQPGLMHDSRHFTKGKGRNTNTIAVVEELFKTGVMDKFLRK